MLPTLNGRIQTRIFMLVVFGGIITLLITPVLPGDPDYRTTYTILATVLVLGIVWEVIYHGLMQWRWEKDWPTLFGLLNAINEGVLVWVLLKLDLVPGIEGDKVPFSAFVIMFLVIWLFIWVWTNGPMRIFNLRWRFFGGRLV